MQDIPRILLVCDADSDHARGIVAGVLGYAREATDWLVQHRNARHILDRRRSATNTTPAGLIADIRERTLAEQLRRFNAPIVNTSTVLPQTGLPTVGLNDYEVGRLAAEHAIDAGYRRFAYLNTRDGFDTARREAGYNDALRKAGFRCESFARRMTRDTPRSSPPPMAASPTTAPANTPRAIAARPTIQLDRRPAPPANVSPYGSPVDQLEQVAAWLGQLEPPTAIFAADDRDADELADICRLAGFDVPGDLAVIGTGNLESRCQINQPPVTCVALPGERVGREAARLLERLMQGAAPPRAPQLIAPLGIIARESTQLNTTGDRYVDAALAFITDHAHQPIHVTDLVDHVNVSRRSLEQRFRRERGRSPMEEINQARLGIAKRLLAESALRVKDIAERAGFTSPEQFSAAFHRETGMTPTAYRAGMQAAG